MIESTLIAKDHPQARSVPTNGWVRRGDRLYFGFEKRVRYITFEPGAETIRVSVKKKVLVMNAARPIGTYKVERQ